LNRNSITDISARAMHHAVRMGIQGKINDNPMMQELDFGGLAKEGRKFVERVQSFGFSSVPLPPIVKKALAAAGGGGGGGAGTQAVGAEQFAADGGGGGDGGGGEGSAEATEAEGIAIFMAGQRNHPVIIGVDDRRHRPMGLKPGENAQYDDAQQMTLMRRNGLYLLSNDNEDGEGKKAERMVSLRHVEKKKQERKPQVQQKSRFELQAMSPRQRRVYAQQLEQQAKDDQAKQDHKHEGETVNTELRVTKKKIEFRNGDEVIADHDKQSNKWNFKGKEHHVTSSDKHTVTSQQVGINGTTVAITGATSVNGNPVATTEMFIPRDAVIAALEQRIAALEARLGP
jgi:phage gp45-like